MKEVITINRLIRVQRTLGCFVAKKRVVAFSTEKKNFIIPVWLAAALEHGLLLRIR